MLMKNSLFPHRCEECNINFSKHQNYVAHKKYYCAANVAKACAPPAPFQIASDNEEDLDSNSPQSPSPVRKKMEKKLQHNKAATLPQASPPQSQHNMAAMAAALLGLDPKSKEAAMLLMKGSLSSNKQDEGKYLEKDE